MAHSDPAPARLRCRDCARVVDHDREPCWYCASTAGSDLVAGQLGLTIDEILIRIDQLQTPRTLAGRRRAMEAQRSVTPCEICDRPIADGEFLCSGCILDLGFESFTPAQQRVKLIRVMQQNRNPF